MSFLFTPHRLKSNKSKIFHFGLLLLQSNEIVTNYEKKDVFLHLEGTSIPVFIHVPIKTCMFVRNSKIKPHATSSNLDLRSGTSNNFVIILNSFKTNTCKPWTNVQRIQLILLYKLHYWDKREWCKTITTAGI